MPNLTPEARFWLGILACFVIVVGSWALVVVCVVLLS
jgi:hypothetical protein